jgi:hypothetical protein
MRHATLVASWAFVLCLSVLPLRAQSLSEAYMLPDLFAIMAEEGRDAASADPAVAGNPAMEAQWARAVARIYDAEEMHDAFVAALDAALAPQVREAALAFAESDLGRRVIQLEITARRALLSDEIDEAARMALARAREAAPGSDDAMALAQVRERVALNDLVDLNVSLGLNTTFAYYDGMVSEGAMQGMAEGDLMALVWSQEPAIRTDIVDWAESYFLMAYKPLTEAEMAEHLDFVGSDPGVAFNAAMFTAFEAVFVDLSRRVGAAMARLMQQDTL